MLGPKHDWIEWFRRILFPFLHPALRRFGGYSIGTVGENQYVGTFDEDEEIIEQEIAATGAIRNPVAAFKTQRDGRLSEGSWAFLHKSDPSYRTEPGMQVHITMFERRDGKPGRELYAHYEHDWRESPAEHLAEIGFDVARGVSIAKEIVDDHTYLIRLE